MTIRRLVTVAACLWLSGAVLAQLAPSADFSRSVVRILNHSQRGDWYSPWGKGPAQRSSGSGFVIGDGLVMTNAHVVSDAQLLLLYLEGDPNPHEGRVVHIGHDCDLALVAPVEPGLLDGLEALEFGGLPRLRSVVETWGYPAGGQRISSTRGVVSRIEMQGFAHSAVDAHLAVQTDAAINPGNSGGPVIQDGRVVGVAFQGMSNLDNVGFFIPTEIIEHFLTDVADGQYDGYPEFGAHTANLENPAARRRAGMSPEQTGVVIDRIYPGSGADGHLEVGDVLMEVDGLPVANDGTVDIGGLRLRHGVIFDRHQVGDRARVVILRRGERLEFDLEMRIFSGLRSLENIYDRLPRYYIVGGLVFVPLDREMLRTYGNDWFSSADKHLIYEAFFRPLEEPERLGRERVVLLRRLDHPVNSEMSWFKNLVVERVNGREVSGLEDLVAAVESNEGEFHLFEFAYYGRFGVLNREKAESSHEEILELYGVPEDRRL